MPALLTSTSSGSNGIRAIDSGSVTSSSTGVMSSPPTSPIASSERVPASTR